MKKLTTYLFVLTLASGTAFAQSTSISEARAQRRAFRDEFMKQVLSEPPKHPVVYAMAALYTGKDLKGGNKQLRDELAKIAGKDKKFSPKEAGDESVKWCMRGWLRVYYLFHDKSTFFAGRLEKDVQAKLEEMFFAYGAYKSKVARTDLKNIWHIQGSENHDMMDLSNAYLALQAVHKLPAYRDRKLPDGHTPAEHVKAWHTYYAQYCLERAKNGLFVEISPTYGKWFVGEFVNMYEFAESKLVRKRMEMLLHLMWADWSVDQLNGVRGGGKTRCYQGAYSQKGDGDSWDLLACHLMGIKGWFWNSHGNMSNLVLMTSRYELPDVVLDIALGKGDFTPFVYQSTRPGRLKGKQRKGIYGLDPKAGGIVRYSYCTPSAIMGSWMLDTRTNYAAIHTQNRWQGIIFSTGINARVFPQSQGLGNGKTYQQHIAVQHRNVMLVANHPKARQTGPLRVFIANNLRKRLTEKDGWVIVREGNAWLGIRPMNEEGFELKQIKQKKVKEASRQNTDGYWLWPKAKNSSVVFVLSRTAAHRTLEDFLNYLKTHKHSIADGHATYRFVDDLNKEVTMELGSKLPVPKINGAPVNLYPKKVFDCPYLSSDHGSGVVTIQKGDRKLILDFNTEAK